MEALATQMITLKRKIHNKSVISLGGSVRMEDRTVFVVDRCKKTPEEFFTTYFKNSSLIDGYILSYEGKEYYLNKMDLVGEEFQRDIEFYTLEKAIN